MDTIALYGIGGVVLTVAVCGGLFAFLIYKINHPQ